jgi:hypothetical protein
MNSPVYQGHNDLTYARLPRMVNPQYSSEVRQRRFQPLRWYHVNCIRGVTFVYGPDLTHQNTN